MLDSAHFDHRLAHFQQWQETPWGRLRYSIVEANLARHLGGHPLRVLDVAGGNGREAVRLAMRGHHVTILDTAPVSLAEAEQHASAQGVADRIEVRKGDACDVPELFPDQDFDLLLCHNLLQYVPDRAAVVRAIAQRLRPGGLLSVLGPNAVAVPLETAVRELDLDAALRALDATSKHNPVYAADTPLLTADEIGGYFRESGLEIVGHHGVINVCHLIADNEIKHDPEFFARLEKLEHALAGRAPYPSTARLFHLVGQLPG
ncbi:methyltransferase domain-containing protein [Planomonospora sp. ID67723]|uniref:methyltransferase domain-containing protein n=1 Tax=Planomonospora sp. ID67723 TaxID=2738134 RepID=UPI0018C4190A|nr:methyltransferase domain-containing protein [Planomonospora sp. ID67723]MBG0827853.1 methyltransferase domain-containing protein [Planomonospora sp. ID67723]